MEKPLLIDLDGVLRIGREPAIHIEQFLEYLELNSINSCILSNSSLYNSKQIYDFFESHSISINFPIITAIDAAHTYIEKKYNRVAVYTSDNVIGQFADYLDFENPEAVLIGDIGNVWNYKLIQTIFEYVQNGAELIAAHKNKFWNQPDIGIQLDAGPFIHAIEFAASRQATLIGKPSSPYFEMALDKINCKLSEPFIMLGDDLDSDMAGAKVLGAQTILIYTGKTMPPFPEEYGDKIDFEAEDLIAVRDLLERIKS